MHIVHRFKGIILLFFSSLFNCKSNFFSFELLRATTSVNAKFLSILQKKPTFSILHTHFYKTPTAICLFYHLFYLNNHFPHFFYYYLSQFSLSLSPFMVWNSLSPFPIWNSLSPFTVTSNDPSTNPPRLKLANPQAPIRHKHRSTEICSSRPKHSDLLHKHQDSF